MRTLVTGADGFVGGWLVERLVRDGHDVTATRQAGRPVPDLGDVRQVELELCDNPSVHRAVSPGFDAVVHLAAVASGADARADPGAAWEVNAAGTVRLCEALAAERTAGRGDPVVLLVSSAEVYGSGRAGSRVETDPIVPCSPYGASKAASEIAGFEVHRRTGLRVVVARSFPHTGRGQDRRFVVPSFARRLLEAKASGAATVPVGNLDPVRDFLHVSDVVEAYVALLRSGRPGEAYNVASGRGVSIRQLFDRLAALIGMRAEPASDPGLARQSDIQHLVGDAGKLRDATGWTPCVGLDEVLQEVIRAQAD